MHKSTRRPALRPIRILPTIVLGEVSGSGMGTEPLRAIAVLRRDDTTPTETEPPFGLRSGGTDPTT